MILFIMNKKNKIFYWCWIFVLLLSIICMIFYQLPVYLHCRCWTGYYVSLEIQKLWFISNLLVFVRSIYVFYKKEFTSICFIYVFIPFFSYLIFNFFGYYFGFMAH